MKDIFQLHFDCFLTVLAPFTAYPMSICLSNEYFLTIQNHLHTEWNYVYSFYFEHSTILYNNFMVDCIGL